jgi:hypothetical protein
MLANAVHPGGDAADGFRLNPLKITDERKLSYFHFRRK